MGGALFMASGGVACWVGKGAKTAPTQPCTTADAPLPTLSFFAPFLPWAKSREPVRCAYRPRRAILLPYNLYNLQPHSPAWLTFGRPQRAPHREPAGSTRHREARQSLRRLMEVHNLLRNEQNRNRPKRWCAGASRTAHREKGKSHVVVSQTCRRGGSGLGFARVQLQPGLHPGRTAR